MTPQTVENLSAALPQNRKNAQHEIFNNNEIVFYDDLNDLSSKIKYYKKNNKNRKKISKNGKKKYFKLFNEKRISEYLINKSLGNKFQLF